MGSVDRCVSVQYRVFLSCLSSFPAGRARKGPSFRPHLLVAHAERHLQSVPAASCRRFFQIDLYLFLLLPLAFLLLPHPLPVLSHLLCATSPPRRCNLRRPLEALAQPSVSLRTGTCRRTSQDSGSAMRRSEGVRVRAMPQIVLSHADKRSRR
jgi:hypothetical protein